MAQGKPQHLLSELKSARVASGLTQNQLAAKTGIPRTTISKIEAGFRNTTLKTLFDLSRAVNLDLKLVKQNLIAQAKKLERGFTTLNLISISRENILTNYDFFTRQFPNHEIWPVLKANAYGHGLEIMAQILAERQPTYLAVDSYFEALKIWTINPQQRILIIGAILPKNFPELDFSRVTLTIYDQLSLQALGKLRRPIKIHLKINTGFNRQGLGLAEIADFCHQLQEFPQIELEGVMSHLADADNPNPKFTRKQETNFHQALELIGAAGFKPRYRHLDATAGSVVTDKKFSNAIRLGIGLYGYNPLPFDHPQFRQLQSLQPALDFTTRVVNLIDLKPGDKVSYAGTFTAKRTTRIGVIPVGYYDFYDRKLSNVGQVTMQNRAFPIVGTICMNMAMVDFGHHPIKLYDQVEVISHHHHAPNSIANLSHLSHSIVYETLVKINQNTRRQIV